MKFKKYIYLILFLFVQQIIAQTKVADNFFRDFSYERAADLYKEALEFEGFYDAGFLSPTSFRNIVFFALRTKEFDWAESFVNTYGERLKEEQRENAKTFNLARIAFYKKEFNQVIQFFEHISYWNR